MSCPPAAHDLRYRLRGRGGDQGLAGHGLLRLHEWYGRFSDEIAGKKFCHIAASWPGVGHNISPGAWDLVRQCFQLATGLPGKSATEEVEISAEWKNLDGLAKKAPPAKPRRPTPLPFPALPALQIQLISPHDRPHPTHRQ
jgi:hypothetical protein